MPVYTTRVGDSCDTVRDIVALYVPDGCAVLDCTYGLGRFWKHFPDRDERWEFFSNDIDPERGYYHHDCRDFPEQWGCSFDAVFLDPPFKLNSKSLAGSISHSYGIAERVLSGIYGVVAVLQLYQEAMDEALRLLKPKGIVVVRCMDQIMGGKQHRQSILVWEHATRVLGMTDEDLFIMKRKTNPLMRHKRQIHARKNNSVFWVFRAR